MANVEGAARLGGNAATPGESENTRKDGNRNENRPGHGEADQLRVGWKARTADGQRASRADDEAGCSSRLSALLQGHASEFFCKPCGAVNTGGTLEAAEVSVQRSWRRRDAKSKEVLCRTRKLRQMRGALFLIAAHISVTLLDDLTHRGLAISLVIKK